MRIVLAMAAFLAFLPNANAADSGDKSDKQLTWNAEYRARYVFEDNQSGNTGIQPNNGNTVEQRLTLGANYKVSERFAFTGTLLNNLTWGSQDLYVYNANGSPGTFSTGDSSGVHSGTGNSNNLLMIQNAYGSWMVNDHFLVRFGRGSLTLADGSVISVNDWEPFPYSFDGVLGAYETSFGRFSAWAVKLAQYDNGATATALGLSMTGTGTGTSGNFQSDPEADAFGLSFDLKTMPEWLKMVNVHLIDNSKAATPGAFWVNGMSADPISTMGQQTIRYGLAVAGAVSLIDYKVDFAGNTGKYQCLGSMADGCNGYNQPYNNFSGATVNRTLNTLDTNSYMAQAEVGANFPDFMKARVFVKFHYDTGDSETAGNQTKIGTYDSYYYDKISGSGLMEVVGWGNLTYYNAGLSVEPTDQTSVQLQYFLFQKSEASGQMNPGRYGQMVEFTSPNSSDLGSEVDLSVEHKYEGGFAILARGGVFLPGDSIKNGLIDNSLSTASLSAVFTQALVQGKMSF